MCSTRSGRRSTDQADLRERLKSAGQTAPREPRAARASSSPPHHRLGSGANASITPAGTKGIRSPDGLHEAEPSVRSPSCMKAAPPRLGSRSRSRECAREVGATRRRPLDTRPLVIAFIVGDEVAGECFSDGVPKRSGGRGRSGCREAVGFRGCRPGGLRPCRSWVRTSLVRIVSRCC